MLVVEAPQSAPQAEQQAPVSGLTQAEAEARLRRDGPNALTRSEGMTSARLLLAQFATGMVYLLLGAAVLSALLGEWVDSVAIGAIILLNAVVGFAQEYRADRAIKALRQMTAPRARVIRDGYTMVVPAAEVVVGDALVLDAGDVVAADGLLLTAHSLRMNEAALTGESVPTTKSTETAPDGAPLAEQRHRVFAGTSVAAGTAHAEVTATGMGTEMGRIADLIEGTTDEVTPLKRRLERVSRTLVAACLGIVVLVALLGLLRGLPWLDVMLVAVALAVAAVPEGMPAIVTISLALGVQRMSERQVLVRRLMSVETLGCATVVCTDKTGTLTTGEMRVREVWGPDEHALLFAAAACNDAEIDGGAATGGPTEIALLRAAAERGITRSEIEAALPRVDVEPFSSASRQMWVRRTNGVEYGKGAVEVILPQCDRGTEGAAAANDSMARRGLRVLAVTTGQRPDGLELLGLLGVADPPRPEAIAAVAQAHRAGIQTVMITGDHPVTAHAIARELGICSEGVSPEDVVYARATAEDKIDIVRRWKERGAVVAMTGDGVNDAPAIREAHIGIAMGDTGTEVTREASDMILTDGNFASIIAAVREGRGIFDNIRKTLVYLLAGNAGELSVMFGAALAGLAMPLVPLQLLWINLVTDGLPALALVTDPPEEGVLDRPPRDPSETMLGREEWGRIGATALLDAGVTIAVFLWALQTHELDVARTLAFTTLVFCELLRAFAARHPSLVLWEVGVLTNPRLLAVVAASVALQLVILSLPPFRSLLHLSALTPAQVGLALGLGLVPVTVLEMSKLLHRLVTPGAASQPNS